MEIEFNYENWNIELFLQKNCIDFDVSKEFLYLNILLSMLQMIA